MRRFLARSFLVLGLLGSDAFAFERTVGNWQIYPWADEKGQVAFCGMSARYVSGISLTFALFTNGQWAIAFEHPDWRLQPGQKYRVSYAIDRNSPRIGDAEAVGEKMVILRLPDGADAFTAFQRGRRLSVNAAAEQLQFDLADTSSALAAADQCVSESARLNAARAGSGNPFAAESPNARSSGSQRQPSQQLHRRPELDAEAMTFTSNIVSMAGFQGARFNVPDANDAPNAEWRAENVYGAVIIRPDVQSAESFISQILFADAGSCAGKFASGSLGDEGTALRRVFTMCETPQQRMEIQYILAPRRQGGYWLIAILEDQGTASEAADRVFPIMVEAMKAAEKQ